MIDMERVNREYEEYFLYPEEIKVEKQAAGYEEIPHFTEEELLKIYCVAQCNGYSGLKEVIKKNVGEKKALKAYHMWRWDVTEEEFEDWYLNKRLDEYDYEKIETSSETTLTIAAKPEKNKGILNRLSSIFRHSR